VEPAAADPLTAAALARHRRRGIVAVVAGVPMFVVGAVLIDRSASEAGEIKNVWDVVGGLFAGVGVSAAVVGAGVLVHWVRWRRRLRRSSWITSPVRTTLVWFLARDGRTLVYLPAFDPGTVYSMGTTVLWNRAELLASEQADVAGTPGRRCVVAVAGRTVMMSIRPPRLESTRRRWRQAMDGEDGNDTST
jgi:hypothetical protein